jgi:hypothetical protein
MGLVISAMPTDIAAQLRTDPTGRRIALDDVGGPCRHCLQLGAPGEVLLLLTYQPFAGGGPYAVPSPVFLHADACERYGSTSIPPFARHGQRAVRTYDGDNELIDGVVVDGSALDDALAAMLANDDAAFAHVHSADAGCFSFRVDGAPTTPRSRPRRAPA